MVVGLARMIAYVQALDTWTLSAAVALAILVTIAVVCMVVVSKMDD